MSNDFKQVLEARTQNLKGQNSRRDNFSRNTVASSLTAASPIVSRSSVLVGDEHRTTNEDDALINMGSNGIKERSGKLQNTYLATCLEAIQNMEQTIIELGNLFTQLAIMVQQQDELVRRIDANVDEA